MTYSSRGRSITEVILAVMIFGFLTGFVAVLCIGNYYRAKMAMERQKQTRLAKLTGMARGLNNGSGRDGAATAGASPSRSHYSSTSTSSAGGDGGATTTSSLHTATADDDAQHLLNPHDIQTTSQIAAVTAAAGQQQQRQRRGLAVSRQHAVDLEGTKSLLFQVNDNNNNKQ